MQRMKEAEAGTLCYRSSGIAFSPASRTETGDIVTLPNLISDPMKLVLKAELQKCSFFVKSEGIR